MSYKKAIMKVPSYEPSWPQNADKSSAADSKVLQLKGSPVKEPIVFKVPLPSVNVTTPLISQNINTRTVHNKENTTGKDHDRTIDQGLEDSGYLSQHNSHIEDDDDHIYGQPTTNLNASAASHDKHITPKPSPTKTQDMRHTPSVMGVFTPIEMHRKRHNTYSMSSTPADHPNLPILKFEQAVCEELAKSFHKNKRYDWSIIRTLAEDYNLDRVIGGQMGVDYVDMFSSLLSRNMKCILAQILALLGDMDIISCKKVSKTWRQIIHEDSATLKRCQQAEKTLRELEQCRRKACGLTRDVTVSRMVLSSMQRVATSSTSSQSSPLSSGTKGNSVSSLKTKTPDCTRFDQYVKAASTLKNNESLRHCKRCGSPATHLKEAQRATCTRLSCQFDFCTCCQEAFHGSTPCRVVHPRPHFSTSKTSTILPGSARSKRNIRRL